MTRLTREDANEVQTNELECTAFRVRTFHTEEDEPYIAVYAGDYGPYYRVPKGGSITLEVI